ncbi:MAG: type I-F CRISPR-associated protein Csy2 [Methylobacter sp.]|uniref:Type I-F CRISPR-associated protein Csy2 n=1 Tax=Candidatus Methylobacter titanis TaxID=3053457 RepID=A0AA43Q3U3_9GAMM|nr:type I-F CRISPR-associated protein Csy2 [Candidatus Methylobacter titanis]MDI1293272.1 type I-F CRISPR-associated protein Csy2 [Candidatus Methylobacter titanis]
MRCILLLPKLEIHNANALSSPYTIGFPAMTAWLGAVHALQRRLNQAGHPELRFTRAGVVCHDIKLHTHQGRGDYVQSIIGTGNPLDKNGGRPSFIEEARCDLTVSLLIEYDSLARSVTADGYIKAVEKQLHLIKWASGDLVHYAEPQLKAIDDAKSLRQLTRQLMPSYTLIERRDLMTEAMQDGQDAIDALLDYLTVQHRSQLNDDNIEWTANRKTKGWLVPIANGFQGISELGIAENQRDPDTLHRFAESLVTLGEFIMPYRVKHLDELLWHSHYNADNNLYLIQQNPRNA